MMLSKEKEWISKIAMMSLLSGDVYISDYYFIVSINCARMIEADCTLIKTRNQKMNTTSLCLCYGCLL